MHRGSVVRKLVACGVALIVAACSGPSATVSPAPVPTQGAVVSPSPATAPTSEASSSPSVAPTAAPTEQPTFGTPQTYPPGAAIKVAVNELNIRRRPATTAKRIQILKQGDVLIVSPADNINLGWGPVKANGYTWYPVMLANVFDTDLDLDPLPKSPLVYGGEPTSGWIATDDGDQSFVTSVAPRCPTTVDLLNVNGMLPAERIACFGPESFVLEGTYGCASCGAIAFGTYKPAWLATPIELQFLTLDVTETFGPLALRFPPDGPAEPDPGSIIRVTVHVDDARATKCQITESDGGDTITPVDKATAVFYCRERLIVESFEVLGPDPDWPES